MFHRRIQTQIRGEYVSAVREHPMVEFHHGVLPCAEVVVAVVHMQLEMLAPAFFTDNRFL